VRTKAGSIGAGVGSHSRTGARSRKSSLLHHVRHSSALVRLPRGLREFDRYGAEGSGRPPGGQAGQPRLWFALGHGAVVCAGRAIVHTPAGSIYASAKSAFFRRTADYVTATREAGCPGRGIHSLPETLFRTEAQDAVEQSEVAVPRAVPARGLAGSRSQTCRARRGRASREKSCHLP